MTGRRRFSYWLAYALQCEREKAGVPISTVAAILDVHPRTLERFEDIDPDGGKEKGYGDEPDRYVAGYAYAIGMDDARQLWLRAAKLWIKEGAVPDFIDELPGARFLRPIRDEARRHSPAPDERSGTRSANKNH